MRPTTLLVLVLVGPADDDPLRLHRHGHRPVTGPVLGVDRVVLDGGVEPQPVALLAVVEGALQGAGAAPAAAPSAAPAAAAARLVVVRLLLGLERRGDEGVVLGAQVKLLDTDDRGAALVGVSGPVGHELVLAL